MKTMKTAMLAATIAFFLMTGCTHKGEPNKRGKLLSAEQIKALGKDQSMNGKTVTIEGYAGICGSMFATAGKKNDMDIYADDFCKGEKLITAKIEFGGTSEPLTGEEYRNYVESTTNFENSTIKLMTDDYQRLTNGKLKFSGTLIYNGDDYYLDNVIIYK